MNALTVKDLYLEMKQRVLKGQGDYIVFVTDDEEGNGYHALWYNGLEVAEMEDYERESYEETNCDFSLVENNPEKAIYIG